MRKHRLRSSQEWDAPYGFGKFDGSLSHGCRGWRIVDGERLGTKQMREGDDIRPGERRLVTARFGEAIPHIVR